MHRRPGTPWGEKDYKAYTRLLKSGVIHLDELLMVERSYKKQWPPERDRNDLRHNLDTLLNNWTSEVDKARIYCGKHPVRSARSNIIPMPIMQKDEKPWEPPQGPEEEEKLRKFLEEMASRGSKAGKRMLNDMSQQRLNLDEAAG